MTRRKAASPIDVAEAAYRLDLDPRAWLHNLATLVQPLIDDGHGLWAYYWDAATPPARWLDRAVLLGDIDRRQIRLARQLVQRDDRATVETIHVHPEPLDSATQAARRSGLGDIHANPQTVRYFAQTGYRDHLALRTIEPEGKGIAITGGQRRERTLDRDTQRLWARVAAHIAAARRLREALGTGGAAPEAVLTPSGRLEHAEGAARTAPLREALREAVVRQERARGKLRRRDPGGAIEIWTALTSGRWSLVDQFERGGRRYLVARPNPHQLPDPRALTPREAAIVALAALGKPVKLIAYELGLGSSTVSTHLAAAMRKLGVATRVELVRVAAQLRARR